MVWCSVVVWCGVWCCDETACRVFYDVVLCCGRVNVIVSNALAVKCSNALYIYIQ